MGFVGAGFVGAAGRERGVALLIGTRPEGGELAGLPEFDQVLQARQQQGQGGEDEGVECRHQPGLGGVAVGFGTGGGSEAGDVAGQEWGVGWGRDF